MNTSSGTYKNTHASQSYARMVKSYPSKKQAIVLQYLEELPLIDYIVTVGRLVGPQKVLSASKISKNRICIYLDSEETVAKLLDKNKTVTINNNTVEIKRLIAPSRRLIISNVHPCIPSSILLEELRKNNMKPTSSIHELHIGLSSNTISDTELAQYTHVTSFRRGVYVEDEENLATPESLLISFKYKTYRIFITDENHRCHICKSNTHLASICPAAKSPDDTNLQNPTLTSVIPEEDGPFEERLAKARAKRATHKHINPSQENSENGKIETEEPISTPGKRQLRRQSDDTSSSISEKITKKKAKEDIQPLAQGIINAISQFAESGDNIYKTPSGDLLEFVDELRKTKTEAIDIDRFSQTSTQFIETLNKLHNSLTHKSTKNRIFKVIHQFRGQNPQLSDEKKQSP